jgi:hypothetical protein
LTAGAGRGAAGRGVGRAISRLGADGEGGAGWAAVGAGGCVGAGGVTSWASAGKLRATATIAAATGASQCFLTR